MFEKIKSIFKKNNGKSEETLKKTYEYTPEETLISIINGDEESPYLLTAVTGQQIIDHLNLKAESFKCKPNAHLMVFIINENSVSEYFYTCTRNQAQNFDNINKNDEFTIRLAHNVFDCELTGIFFISKAIHEKQYRLYNLAERVVKYSDNFVNHSGPFFDKYVAGMLAYFLLYNCMENNVDDITKSLKWIRKQVNKITKIEEFYQFFLETNNDAFIALYMQTPFAHTFLDNIINIRNLYEDDAQDEWILSTRKDVTALADLRDRLNNINVEAIEKINFVFEKGDVFGWVKPLELFGNKIEIFNHMPVDPTAGRALEFSVNDTILEVTFLASPEFKKHIPNKKPIEDIIETLNLYGNYMLKKYKNEIFGHMNIF